MTMVHRANRFADIGYSAEWMPMIAVLGRGSQNLPMTSEGGGWRSMIEAKDDSGEGDASAAARAPRLLQITAI
jgi:hypothetical protein